MFPTQSGLQYIYALVITWTGGCWESLGSAYQFCRRVVLITYPDKIVLAPEFWAGFKSRVWFPAFIKTEHFLYLSVESGDITQ